MPLSYSKLMPARILNKSLSTLLKYKSWVTRTPIFYFCSTKLHLNQMHAYWNSLSLPFHLIGDFSLSKNRLKYCNIHLTMNLPAVPCPSIQRIPLKDEEKNEEKSKKYKRSHLAIEALISIHQLS